MNWNGDGKDEVNNPLGWLRGGVSLFIDCFKILIKARPDEDETLSQFVFSKISVLVLMIFGLGMIIVACSMVYIKYVG